eukprot:m.234385 g.234385  ORF g.234385 m.234385 type:complete len:55 (+) comp19320_c0_seq2:1416-1580(+)
MRTGFVNTSEDKIIQPATTKKAAMIPTACTTFTQSATNSILLQFHTSNNPSTTK